MSPVKYLGPAILGEFAEQNRRDYIGSGGYFVFEMQFVGVPKSLVAVRIVRTNSINLVGSGVFGGHIWPKIESFEAETSDFDANRHLWKSTFLVAIVL